MKLLPLIEDALVDMGKKLTSNGTSKQALTKMHLLISMVMPLKKDYLLKQVQVYG